MGVEGNHEAGKGPPAALGPAALGSSTGGSGALPADEGTAAGSAAEDHVFGEPLEEEEESCLLDDEDAGPPYSMHQPTTNLDLTDAAISQEVQAPAGAPPARTPTLPACPLLLVAASPPSLPCASRHIMCMPCLCQAGHWPALV